MIKAILAFIALGALVVANAIEDTSHLCANNDNAKCKEYCKGKFGVKLIGAECNEKGNKRECVCRFKKEEAGEWRKEEENGDDGYSKHPKGGRPTGSREGGDGGDRHPKDPKGHETCSCSSFPGLSPLTQLFHEQHVQHIFAGSQKTLLDLKAKGYAQHGVIAHIAVNSGGCGANKLEPVWQLRRNTPVVDFVYARADEAAALVKVGYARDGIAFYCSTKADTECGATVGIYKYAWTAGRAGHHMIATDTGYMEANHVKTNQATNQGLLCYAWPSAAGLIPREIQQ